MKNSIVALAILVSVPAFAELKCGGTEPFWNLVIQSKTAVYKNMGEGLEAFLNLSAQAEEQGLKHGTVRKFHFTGDGMSADAVVQKQKCSDGMSDITYPYTIAFSIGQKVLSGCCK